MAEADLSLDRFVTVQRPVYARVIAELTDGHKRSHWIWFIFPQIAGLGSSPTAVHFALSGLEEARAYLAHPQLSARLRECTALMQGWAGRRSAKAILGTLDALKFRSSMTLFERAAGPEDKAPFALALDTFFGSERDEATLGLL